MNELILTNPNGNEAKSIELANKVLLRRREIEEHYRVILEDPTSTVEDLKAAKKSLKSAVEDLRDGGKKMVATVLKETEAMRVITAIDSRLWNYSTKQDESAAYVKLSALVKEFDAKIKSAEDNDLPPPMQHTYILALSITDAGMDDIIKSIPKKGGTYIKHVGVNSDKAAAMIERFFATDGTMKADK